MLFKLAVDKASPYIDFKHFWKCLGEYWYLWHGCWILLVAATILWAYILRHFPFSVAYPLSCISFLFGMIAGHMFLGEQITLNRWIGMGVILIGAFILAK